MSSIDVPDEKQLFYNDKLPSLPQAIREREAMEKHEQYTKGWIAGAVAAQEKPNFSGMVYATEYLQGFGDGKAAYQKARQAAWERPTPPKPVPTPFDPVEDHPWPVTGPSQASLDQAAAAATASDGRYGFTFLQWHHMTTVVGSSPHHVWDWYSGANPLVVKELWEKQKAEAEKRAAPKVMDDGWLERYRENPGLVSYAEACDTIGRIDQIKEERLMFLKRIEELTSLPEGWCCGRRLVFDETTDPENPREAYDTMCGELGHKILKLVLEKFRPDLLTTGTNSK